MPRVSVIIPTYNRAHLVHEAVDSVLTQTFRDLEVIIVDDGSTDDTSAVLAMYTDPRVRVIYQENQGKGAARNTGIRAACSEYVAFLDSDDLWLPHKLERQLAMLTNHSPRAWGYTDAYGFDGETKQILYVFSQQHQQYEGLVERHLILRDFIATSTTIVQRLVFKEVGMFSHAPRAQDWDLWLRIAVNYPICRVPEALVGYRIHKRTGPERLDPMFKHQHHVAAIERAVAFAPKVYGPPHRHALAMQHLRTGEALARRERLVEARQMFWQAIRLRPATLSAYPRLVVTLLGKRLVSSWIRIYRQWLGLPE